MPEFDLPHDSRDLSGEVALVTGASSGLGRRFARVLAKAGATVAVTARRMDRLEELVGEIESEGGQALALRLDMTEVLAVEWSRNHINVNCIAPGSFESEMMSDMIERVGEVWQHFPRKRMGDPAQLDSTLLYLCAPSSECVTGAILKVDDGQMPR